MKLLAVLLGLLPDAAVFTFRTHHTVAYARQGEAAALSAMIR